MGAAHDNHAAARPAAAKCYNLKGATDKGAGLELRKESSLLREAAAGVRAELLLLRCTSNCVGVACNFKAERGAS